MNRISSAEFRRTYARLDRETAVTVNGHPIGTWFPAAEEQRLRSAIRLMLMTHHADETDIAACAVCRSARQLLE